MPPLADGVNSRLSRSIQMSLALVLPLAVAAAVRLDHTWRLPGDGKGLGQHYGFWAYFLTTPIILALTWSLVDRFVGFIGTPALYCSTQSKNLSQRLDRLVETHVRSLLLRSRSRSILVFTIVAMFFWWLVNVAETVSPGGTYQHDVLDAYSHHAGYVVAHIYTLFIFTWVYALAAFMALHVTLSMVSVLRYIQRNDLLKVNFFHEDNCAGASAFGRINLVILGIYANWFIVIYAMYLTHGHRYLVMELSLLSCSVLAVVQSIVAVYYVHSVVEHKRRACLMAINDRLQADAMATTRTGHFPSDLLALRGHLLSVHSYPYSVGVSIVVNVIRFVPALLAVGTFVKHH